MRATLERLVTSGVPALICPRCGWWEGCPDPHTNTAVAIATRACPDCKGPLDAVEPRK